MCVVVGGAEVQAILPTAATTTAGALQPTLATATVGALQPGGGDDTSDEQDTRFVLNRCCKFPCYSILHEGRGGKGVCCVFGGKLFGG